MWQLHPKTAYAILVPADPADQSESQSGAPALPINEEDQRHETEEDTLRHRDREGVDIDARQR